MLSVAREQCAKHAECPEDEVCKGGVCTDACKGHPCGENAICIVKNRRPKCECPVGYFGEDPEAICYESELYFTYN